MRKRALQAALLICAIITSAALWARQEAAATTATPAEIDQRIEKFLRNYYAWGPAFQVKAEAPKPSPIPGLYEVPVQVSYQGQSGDSIVYVTPDGHYVIRGVVNSLLGNPFAAIVQKLDINNHPHVGPAKACVNVVEFSDFECPHCQAAYKDLQQIEPKYPQVRFTFMDFPLTKIHPWAMTAALAAQCVYQEKPSAYPQMQKLIFDNQDQITPDNAYNKLVGFASQLGLNSQNVHACVSSPETKKQVDADIALGNQLNVSETPTLFVNGRPMVGENPQELDQFISYELAQCQAAH
jgi:protein-disulfide isomerase